MFTYNENDSVTAKKKFNKNEKLRNIYWRKYSQSSCIGECMKLCGMLNPKDCYEFEIKYHQYAEDNKDKLAVKERGLTKDELNQLVLKYKKECETNDGTLTFSEKEYYDCLICHIITETFYGWKRECELLEHIRNLGYKIEKPRKYEFDSKYSMDYIVYKGNSNTFNFFIQCKPISFYKGFRYTDTYNDHVKLVESYYNIKRDFNNKKLYVCIYDTDDNCNVTWVANKNNGITHNVEEIYDTSDYKNKLILKELSKNRVKI